MMHPTKHVLAVATCIVATAFIAPVQAQRLSLAERVDQLEQKVDGSGAKGGAVDLVNQISALQSQVQSLQGQVEELKHALDEARKNAKDQYIDLDSRIGRLEGRAPGTTPGGVSAAPANTPAQPPDVDLGSPANHPSSADFGDLTSEDRAAAPADQDDTPAKAAAPADPAAASAMYNGAFQALKDGRYAESARGFQTFIDSYPDSDLTSNAYYWLGESYYVTQNYETAEQSFRTLLQRYPNSSKAADALLKAGYSEYELKQWDKAEATLNQVVQTYPDTTAARLAQGRLRALKMETHN